MERFREYYRLAKPGIIYGNSFALIAGFIFASDGNVDWLKLLITFVSTGLIIGSACVFNNIIETESDAKMERTKKRALPSGQIKPLSAFIYGASLGAIGTAGLIVFTNSWATTAALVGLIGYIIYTYSKSKTEHSTLIGTLPGAMPPLVGYFAVHPQLNWTALLLFLILVFWQMPHFYAIAIRRKDEYAKAKLPVLTVTRGESAAISQSIVYVSLLVITLVVFYFYQQLSLAYLIIIAFTVYWTRQIYRYRYDYKIWAKRVFIDSLNFLMLWSILTGLEGFL